jgi:hypothetical protein
MTAVPALRNCAQSNLLVFFRSLPTADPPTDDFFAAHPDLISLSTVVHNLGLRVCSTPDQFYDNVLFVFSQWTVFYSQFDRSHPGIIFQDMASELKLKLLKHCKKSGRSDDENRLHDLRKMDYELTRMKQRPYPEAGNTWLPVSRRFGTPEDGIPDKVDPELYFALW